MNFTSKMSDWNGYIDVGNKWMLAICVGDDFLILMPEIRYKWTLFVVEKRRLDRRWKIKDVSDENTQNRHQQSQNCRKHISSPTSVTNIDVADRNYLNNEDNPNDNFSLE